MEKMKRRERRRLRAAAEKQRAQEPIPYESAYGANPSAPLPLLQPAPLPENGRKAARRQRRESRKQQARDTYTRVRHWFLNLSLRNSFMAYVICFVLIAVFLCFTMIFALQNARDDILVQYEYTVDGVVEYYYLADDQMLFRMEDGSMTFVPVTVGDRVTYTVLGALMVLCIPTVPLACIFLAAVLFYRQKLKKPIAELTAASVRIGENNLDFHIRYDNEDELGLLCASFESMRNALEQNNREMWRQVEERKRLNAAFSHDLRTPLTVLRGHTELLHTYLPMGKIGEEKALHTLDTMAGQIARLERYVEAMQSVQRLTDLEATRQRLEREPFLRELQDTAVLLCGKLTIHFTQASDGGPLLLDPAMVMQVHENLLANAARYAKSELWVDYLHSEGLFCIRISDDGAGFNEDGLQKAAQPFYRDADNKRGGQFGLGLYICSILCERHGGKLRISNRPEGGARILASFAERE